MVKVYMKVCGVFFVCGLLCVGFFGGGGGGEG